MTFLADGCWVSRPHWGLPPAVTQPGHWVGNRIGQADVFLPFLCPLGPPRCLLTPAHGFLEDRYIPDPELPTLPVIAHLCPQARPRTSYKVSSLFSPQTPSSVLAVGPYPLLLRWLLPQWSHCLHRRCCLVHVEGRPRSSRLAEPALPSLSPTL